MSHDQHAVLGQQPHTQAHQLPRRVVIHIDLDCFYCQVEQKRLSIPEHVPCAVQQWQGLIAVNYAARAAGITRHMRVREAKKLCPELQLVHVQTIGGEYTVAPVGGQAECTGAAAAAAEVPQTADDATDNAVTDHQHADVDADVEGSATDRGSSKASLQRYRKASAEIMRLLAQSSPGCAFEKASIDEAYLDITTLAAQELSQAEAQDGGLSDLLSRACEASTVLGDGRLQADVDFDRLAAAGAVIAQRLRATVAQQLSFTCSAGIGPNKLLAKIGSAKNKPNKQTVVLPRATGSLMQDLPLGKVKGLGGKLGGKLEGLGAATAGAAAALSWEVLVDAFGGKALWVWETVRGIDSEAVAPKSLVKSINSCKSFEATSDAADVTRWLTVLAAELAERMMEDEADHARRARTLVLQYRTSSVRNAPDRSIRGALPRCGREGFTTQGLAAAGQVLFKRITPAPYPLVRLALAATDFVDLPRHGGGGSTAALQRFLAAGTHQQQHQEQQQAALLPNGQQQPMQHTGVKRPAAPQQHQQGRQSGSRKQAIGQMRLEQFARPATAAAPQEQQQGHHAGQSSIHHQQAADGGSMQPPQDQHTVQQPLHAAGQQHMEPQQQQANCDASHMPQHPARLISHSAQQQDESHSLQAQQQVDPQRSQQADGQVQESLEQLAALAGVDLASQARILRDIEIQGMVRSRHQQQQAGSGAGGSGSGGGQQPQKKRKGPQQSGRQMRISNLFGAKQ